MSRKHIKETRRIQLIAANMACIARYGLTDTTISHVSKEAEMSRGIVNFYFESKEKMMQETLRFLNEEYGQTLAQSGNTPEALVRGHFSPKLCNARRLGVWAAFVAHAATHAPYRKLLATARQQMLEAFAKAGRTEQAADIAALIEGLWLEFLLAPEGQKREALVERCLAFLELKPTLKLAAQTVKPVKSGKKTADEQPSLLDFGDLFAKKA